MTPPSVSDNSLIWLIVAGIVLALAGAISALLVWLDIARRGAVGDGSKKPSFLWIALALLLPGLGLGIYFLARFLDSFLTPGDGREPPLWVTRVKRPRPSAGGVPGAGNETIVAADLLRPPPAPPARPPDLPRPAVGGPAIRAPGSPLPAVEGAGAITYNIKVSAGPEAGQSFTLASLPQVIGRGSDADISLDGDQSVSRRHAELYQRGTALHIRDLDSAHGTAVNGASIQDKGLKPGDRIQLGRTTLILQASRRSP